jgi:alpha-galactosidase
MKTVITMPWRQLLAVLVVSVFSNDRPADAAIQMGTLDVSRILFLGNSITYHPSLPSIGWYNNWGMAASSEDKDYVHVLTTAIAERTGARPEIMVKNIAEFEWNYTTYSVSSKLSTELAFKPTLLVLAIGENATVVSAADQVNYGNAYANLLETFKTNSNPTVFTRSCFWADSVKDSVMQTVTVAERGTYVDISTLGSNPLNYAYSEAPYASDSAFNSHPGDRGMAAIADALFTSMVAQSVPEPSTWALLCAGTACLGVFYRSKVQFSRSSVATSKTV